jgi:hypothetical protein
MLRGGGKRVAAARRTDFPRAPVTTGSGKWWRLGNRSITGALAEGICAIEDLSSFGEHTALKRKGNYIRDYTEPMK